MSQIVIERCTRDGFTSWQAVARQLGTSVDSVRAQWDPSYARAHAWAPSREPLQQADPEDVIDHSSPRAKIISRRKRILQLLEKQPRSAAEIHAALQVAPLESIWVRLSELSKRGLVLNDGCCPRTYRLSEAGKAYIVEKVRVAA